MVPFIRPYRVRADIGSWFGDPSIFDLVQESSSAATTAASANFTSVGQRGEDEWVKKTVDFAVANDLYLHAHADAEAVEILMGHNPRARIIWAHTGFWPVDRAGGRDAVEISGGVGRTFLSLRHRRWRRQADGGVALAVPKISRPLPARLGHLDQRALGELRRDHGRLSRLARATAAEDRGARSRTATRRRCSPSRPR